MEEEAFIGEIRMFPYNYAPRGWVDCDGRKMPISQFTTLYAVINMIYGGDGKTYFNVPDLRGRVAVGYGDDPSDSFDPQIGTFGGSEKVGLGLINLPPHTHDLIGATQPVPLRSNTPAGNLIGQVTYRPLPSGTPFVSANAFTTNQPISTNQVTMNNKSLDPFMGAGNNHENRQPFLGIRFCICFDGVFPPKN